MNIMEENIRKENIFAKMISGIKRIWDRLGEPDVDDYDVELPDELKNQHIEAEDMLKATHHVNSWNLEVEKGKIENAKQVEKAKTKQVKNKEEDYIRE